MLNITKFLHVFTLSFCISLSVWAAKTGGLDADLQKLLELDIEKLAKVSVASKREESIEDAPGIITVVTAEEIARYGYRNLRDILDRQTHMQIIGSSAFPHSRTSLRGSSFTHTDNTVLPLINGRPIRDGSSVSNNHDLYAAFPVESIKQIEIIRGPGSVLYGTNAFAGVINIITKDAPENPEASASISYGSYTSRKGTMSYSGKWDDFEVIGSFNGFDSNGDDFNNITDEFGRMSTYETGAGGVSAVFNAKYKGFTVNSLLTDTSHDNHNAIFTFPGDDLETDRRYVDLGYMHNLTDNWDVSANVLYHNYDMDFTLIGGTPLPTGVKSDNFFAEVTTRAKLTEKLSLLAGASYDEIDGTLKNSSQTYNNYTVSAYTQIDFWLFDWLKLIGGVQYNDPEQLSGEFSPRGGLIAHFNDQWGLKILYGEAFRQPSPIDRS